MKILIFTLIAGVFASPLQDKPKDFIPRLPDLNMHPRKLTVPSSSAPRAINPQELNNDFWLKSAQNHVEERLKIKHNTNKAKNVILFIGDGMSTFSVAAARLLLGGEEKKLSFENFPFVASSKTYCVDTQVADSACTATAYLCGVKTNDGELGVNAKAKYANCADAIDETTYVDSIAAWFQKQNRSTGLVTSTRITHATPGALYSHTTSRDWENDYEIRVDGCDSDRIDDIAEQLVHGDVGSKFKVILGAGSRNFVTNTTMENNGSGYRRDGKNLIQEWERKTEFGKRQYVRNRSELMAVNVNEIDQLFGMFGWSHINYWIDTLRDNLTSVDPTLAELTLKAIEMLKKDEDGYFMLVEGGRIDHGHHDNQAKHAISEAVQFSEAIQAAVDAVNLDETLIVVSADHGHVMTISGYADRGNDIFGYGGEGDDGLPYNTLAYANGNGYLTHFKDGVRVDPRTLNYTENAFKFPSPVPRDSETHGGEDVGIWAIGPWAHLFTGTLEQNMIPHIMAYASCVGKGLTSCD